MMISKKKLIAAITSIIAVIAISYIYIDYLDYYFLHMLRLSIACFEQDLPSYGVIVFLMQLTAWVLFAIFFYFSVINMIFPRIRGVNAMRTKNTFCRKILQIEGKDKDYAYLKVKFTFFPFFDWYTLKLPKPNKNITYRRMPQSIDIQSENIDLVYNDDEQCYEITDKPQGRIEDDDKYYKRITAEAVKGIGEQIGTAIQGDSNMMKDYYTMNLVMDENRDPIPKKNLKRPPNDLEKEVGDDDR